MSFSRLSLTLILLTAAVFTGLGLVLTRPACTAVCAQTALLAAGGILSGTAVLLILFFQRRVSRQMKALTAAAEALRAGEPRRHVLPSGPAEISQFTHTFDEMTEAVTGRLQALTRDQKQVSLVLATMADGVLITDEEGVVQLLNPAAARLLRLPADAGNGRSLAELLRHHQLIDLWQAARQSNEEMTAAVEIDSRLFLQVVISPFHDANGRGAVVLLQDLTQVHRLQTIRRDFVSNISHELRTPLASLRAVVETLRDGALDDPPAAARFLQRAEHEVDTLTQMVEELLELSRIESGQVPLRLAQTAVLDLLSPALERLRPFARRGDVELILDLPAGLPPVLADAGRIQQVVTNLVHNAIKFTPAGGKVTVAAVVAEKEAAVQFSVSDTGAGIPAADLPRIFERFYKSDRARTRDKGGTGLGLAIARHIVQAHNGRLHAKSKEGKGSTFTFTLPVA